MTDQPDFIKVITDILRDEEALFGWAYNGTETKDNKYLFTETWQFEFMIFLETGETRFRYKNTHPRFAQSRYPKWEIIPDLTRGNMDDFMMLANAVHNQRHYKPDTTDFRTVCDLLLNPDLKIDSKHQPLKGFFNATTEATIRFQNEEGDTFTIGIETGRTKIIRNGLGIITIQFSASEAEHVAFLALTHFQK